jgi:hypothetical protein
MANLKKIDQAWLSDNGVSYDPQQLRKLARKANDILEWRVGVKISELLTDDELAEFEDMVARGTGEEENLAWLEKTVPGYKKVVQTENAKLKRQILRHEDKMSYLSSLKK